MYEKIVECILDSIAGKSIDRGFCRNLIKLNEEDGFEDNAKFLKRIIDFNSFVLDLREIHFFNIPDKFQKNAINILKIKTNEGLNLSWEKEASLAGEQEGELFTEKKYFFWTVDGKNSDSVNEEYAFTFKKKKLLFVDSNERVVSWNGKYILEIKKRLLDFLVILMKNNGQYSLDRLHPVLYGEDWSDNEDDAKRQKRRDISVKSRLKKVLENEKIATIEHYNSKYCLRNLKKKYKDFEYVLIERVNTE